MGFEPMSVVLAVLAYAVPFVVAAVLLYLVIRFGVRDGLRGHERWLERRRGPDA